MRVKLLKENEAGVKIIRSQIDPVEMYVHTDENNIKYSTVYFHYPEGDMLIACCSSQIGCVESCKFCATGSLPFIGNLSQDKMYGQYISSLNALDDIQRNRRPSNLLILLEGMGEASYNFDNAFNGMKKAIPELLSEYKTLRMRISTAGNLGLIDKLEKVVENNVHAITYEFQLSLHSSIDEDRKYLIPGFAKRWGVESTTKEFTSFAHRIGQKPRFNYLLLNFDKKNNYSARHLEELVRLVESGSSLKLTKYSETGKNMSSPNDETYEEVGQFLQSHGIQVHQRSLLGSDILAACGMLNYE